MKRYISFVLCFVLLIAATSSASAAFNYSVFTDDPNFIVDIDEMDDTGNIYVRPDFTICMAIDDNDADGNGIAMIYANDDDTAGMFLSFIISGKDMPQTEKLIIKTDHHRYTFEPVVTEEKGKETLILALVKPGTLNLLKELANDENDAAFRIVGKERNINGHLIVDYKEDLELIYNAYLEAGGLKQSLSSIASLTPCEIKEVTPNVKQEEPETTEDKAADTHVATEKELEALEKAKLVESFAHYSYSGMIDFLMECGYTKEESTYAADHCGADWKEEALQAFDFYIPMLPDINRSNALNVLENVLGFTHEEAIYCLGQRGY